MKKVIIIDDEPLAASLVEEYIAEYPDFEVVDICQDGFEGLKSIQKHAPDLVFLDVQMPRISGFEMLELLEEPPAIVFTTAFDQYAMKAFDSHAVDYLLKPFSRERFDAALKRYYQLGAKAEVADLVQSGLQSSVAQRVVLKDKNEIIVIPTREISHMEANDDFVNIYRGGKKFLKNKTLKYFESGMDEAQFVRVHRSYLVNVGFIQKVENYEKDGYVVRLRTGEGIPVSRTGMVRLKKVLGI
ncbi:DNA-binding response regulator [Echinicola pacifica]|uniref:DNA-binding response regulator n=1 Tax=Echinicola pacifica TaxID=346377 RepID=A0A918QAQ1_9BACT|nr:response regulator [Echinicola pacifica]GGZ39961.1 DNA-binding response regulator [Echinicola pacifica]